MLHIQQLISEIKLIVDNDTNPNIYKNYRYGDVIYRKGWEPHYDEWKTLCKGILSDNSLKNSFLYIYLTQYQSPDKTNTLIKNQRKKSNILKNICVIIGINEEKLKF